jgi:hypothetical protein
MKAEDSLGVIFFLALVALPCYYYYQSCEWRWADSHYESKWDVKAGCRVKTIDEGWVPEANIISKPVKYYSYSKKDIENELHRRGYTQANGEWVNKYGKRISDKQDSTNDTLVNTVQ